MRFLDGGGREALKDAVQAVEARSSAELVVTVRPESGSYAAVDLAWALGAGVAALAFVLFSPAEVPTWALLAEPLAIGLVAWSLSFSTPVLRRLVVSRARRERRVHEAASALFHERRVHQTRGRTGILLHVSLLERTCEVVPDLGVVEAVEAERWDAAVASLRRCLFAGAGAVDFARAVERLGDVLEPALPRSEDDVNELPDEPVA
jgi:putative membrane protein